MQVLQPGATILNFTNDLERHIEKCGRVCWKSEDKIEPGTAAPFIQRLKNLKHESVLEHGSITVSFIIDRGVSHELVRHRLASFSQESTRYCNYGKAKFGQHISVIDIASGFKYDASNPDHAQRLSLWRLAMQDAERYYFAMLDAGATPQEARSVLPNSLKTEVIMTANPREWRHVFRLRCDKAAHPQIREVMQPLYEQFADMWPSLFNDAVVPSEDK